MNAASQKLTIVVSARAIEGTNEFVYHASFKDECGISHWNSRGEASQALVVNRAREVAIEAGYETNEEYEIVKV